MNMTHRISLNSILTGFSSLWIINAMRPAAVSTLFTPNSSNTCNTMEGTLGMAREPQFSALISTNCYDSLNRTAHYGKCRTACSFTLLPLVFLLRTKNCWKWGGALSPQLKITWSCKQEPHRSPTNRASKESANPPEQVAEQQAA